MRARTFDPWTSHAAAGSIDTTAARHYRIILHALKRGPGISYEIAERAGLSNAQVHKRMPEMERKGWVELTGGWRLSPSLRKCRVWRLVPPPPTQLPMNLGPGDPRVG